MTELVVSVHDARVLGYCASGCVRAMKDHGLDHVKFIREGLPISEIEAVEDVRFQTVAKHVRDTRG